jgi:DNA-binding HxlR family transcriptional regulator
MIKKRSGCPISYTLDILGDKWSLLIIRDLLLKDKCYYGDFLHSPEGMATNILADRLKKLKYSDIITSRPGRDKKSQIEYVLTQKGMNLLPVILEIIAWGAKYDHETAASEDFVRRIKTDRNALMLEILQKINKQTL